MIVPKQPWHETTRYIHTLNGWIEDSESSISPQHFITSICDEDRAVFGLKSSFRAIHSVRKFLLFTKLVSFEAILHKPFILYETLTKRKQEFTFPDDFPCVNFYTPCKKKLAAIRLRSTLTGMQSQYRHLRNKCTTQVPRNYSINQNHRKTLHTVKGIVTQTLKKITASSGFWDRHSLCMPHPEST